MLTFKNRYDMRTLYQHALLLSLCLLTILTARAQSAGPDQVLNCVALPGGSVSMGGTGTGVWTARSGNPGTATIASTTSPTTAISSFSAEGVYGFVWTYTGGRDTALVTVTAKPNAGPDRTTRVGGSATMAATGTGRWSTLGSNPGTISISPSSGATAVVSGITVSGTYGLIWTSPAGCTDTALVVVSGTCALTGSAAHTLTGTATATINTSVSGGSGSYTYTWSQYQQDHAPYNSASVANNGIYRITVTDATNGCSVVLTDTVRGLACSVQAPMTATHTGQQYHFAVAVTGAAHPQYRWRIINFNENDYVTTVPYLDVTLMTGQYDLGVTSYVTDSGTGCMYADSLSIPADPAGASQVVVCTTLPGGQATLYTPYGGSGVWTAIPGNPGTCTITSPTASSTSVTNFSAAGTYRFLWTVGGVGDTVLVYVDVPHGGPDRTATVGGSATMAGLSVMSTWSIYAGNPGTSTMTGANGPTPTISGFSVAGTYYYICTVSGCRDTVAVVVSPVPVGGAGPDQTICAGSSTTMGATTSPGVWSALPTNPTGATIYSPTSWVSQIWGLDVAGVYGFIWTTSVGADTMYITTSARPARPVLSVIDGCTDTLVVSQVSGADSLLWFSDNGGLVYRTLATDTIYPNAPLSYDWYVYAKGPNGCISQGSDSVMVTHTPRVDVTVSSAVLCSATADTFTAAPTAGGSTPSYQWYKNSLPVGTNAPVYIPSSLADGDTVWVVMTSVASCATTSTATSSRVTVEVVQRPAAPVLSQTGTCVSGDTLLLHGLSSTSWQTGWSLGTTVLESPVYRSIAAGQTGYGSGLADITGAESVALDAAGNIYVLDGTRILKFPAGSGYGTQGTIVASYAATYPNSICLDAAGNLYLSDAGNNRILKFPAGSTALTTGTVVAGGNGSGTGANRFNYPTGLCVDAAGYLYVVDQGNNRVQRFAPGSTSATNGVTVAGGNGAGSAANQFNQPQAVLVDAAGNLYVSDMQNYRVQKFAAGSSSASNGTTVAGGNGSGSAANQLGVLAGRAMALDAANNLYVLDGINRAVKKYPAGSTSATAGITVAGGNGSTSMLDPNPYQLYAPQGLALSAGGDLYIGDGRFVLKYVAPHLDSVRVPAATGQYTATITSYNGCTSLPSAAITVAPCLSDSVWPGDADHNGVADNNDLLPIGTAYGLNGIARVDQSIVWTAHAATNWGVQFLSGENTKHADCDGNGVIDANDTTAILTNFGLVHSKTDGAGPWRSGIPGIILRYSKDTVVAGDTLVTTLILGDSVSSVSGLYGLAFTFHYDPLVCDSMTTSFVFPNSFLGTPSTKMSLHKDFRTAGEVKAAVTGIDHLNRSGYGAIATFSCIITTDNLNGKDLLYYTNVNYISDIKAVDKDGITLPLNGAADSNSVGYEPSGIHAVHAERVSLYPNPAASQVSIMAQSAITQVTLTDVLGQQALSQSGRNATIQTLDISALAAGVYTVHITTLSGSGTARLVVTR